MTTLALPGWWLSCERGQLSGGRELAGRKFGENLKKKVRHIVHFGYLIIGFRALQLIILNN